MSRPRFLKDNLIRFGALSIGTSLGPLDHDVPAGPRRLSSVANPCIAEQVYSSERRKKRDVAFILQYSAVAHSCAARRRLLC